MTRSLQNSCSEQLFGKLTGRSQHVHKKSSTVRIIQKLFLIRKSTGASEKEHF